MGETSMQPIRVPTRPFLRSFWLVLTLSAAIVVSVALTAFRVPHAIPMGIGFFAVSSVLGLLSPGIAIRPFRSWDRLARKARRAVRLWLSGEVFLMLMLIGLLGARLPLNRPSPAESGWIPRTSTSGRRKDYPHCIKAAGGGTAWIRRFASWAWHSGNIWACSLLPVLALLKAVEGESRGSLGGNVYTLY